MAVSPTFRKIIVNATGKLLEEIQATPLAVTWTEAEKKLKPEQKKKRQERLDQIAWRY